MQIQESSISFPTTRGSGPQQGSTTLVFPRNVARAVAGVRGYQIGFVGDDHHVGLLQVELDTEINANTVLVRGRLGCRDWSGNWDDEYNGSIQVTVLAELESATAPPPRGDLQILDMEVNQATQYFRSAEHLDVGNVMPDNSMPLIGGKITGLRFYVDYDDSAGLPPISTLSSELTVRSAGTTMTLSPLAEITPRAATEIDRAQADHTLNFAIPAAWCRGTLEVSCRVFDSGAPGQRSSAYQRTLKFVDVNPMRVYGVGINYTGAGLDLAAPTATDLQATFNFTRKVWPTGDVLASGFTTIEFSEDLSGNAANGCGSGFSSLLGQIKDLKGDTDDLVYGLLPGGTPLTGVGGCGGGGAGVGMTGAGVTAAHEAGHAVGRQHAPCDDSARCDSPQNQDDDYPLYGNYVSDSIGEFGFDPAVNRVHDPAVRRDFMGYSGNAWISPYTYRALLSKGDPIPYTPFSAFGFSFFAASAVLSNNSDKNQAAADLVARPEWIRKRQPLIFLQIYVDGDKVSLLPSFTYPALIRRPGPDTDFEVHLEGEQGEVLACVTLQMACAACGTDCGPVHLQGEVPWDEGAKALVLRRDGKELKRFAVEPKPEISAKADYDEERNIQVCWSVAGHEDPMWYLVQWQDRDGTWRGVAPRTQETSMLVPRRYAWATKGKLKLRVLAVNSLNTASQEFEIKSEEREPPNRIDVHDVSEDDVFRAVITDPIGRTLPAGDLVWYGDDGGEIARGRDLPRRLSSKQGVATVRMLGSGVLAGEGYVLSGVDEQQTRCGGRPTGAAARKALREAEHLTEDEDES